MLRIVRHVLQTAAVFGLIVSIAPAMAGERSVAVSQADATAGAAGRGAGFQVATHLSRQTAAMPVGTIRLRVIPRIGGKAIREQIKWIVKTFGRDGSGQRHTVAEVTGPTPELTLPAGWYVVHARLRDKLIRHPVEVTAGRTFKYTLVKQ